MQSIVEASDFFNSQLEADSAALTLLDLVEFETEYYWEKYEQAALEAQQYLVHYHAARQEREALAQLVAKALAEVEDLLQ